MPLPLMKPRRLPISCLILNLLCVCLAGRVAAAVFDRPSGTDSNTVYAIAASIGGPTNGITAATGTNIAAYQALIATQNFTTVVVPTRPTVPPVPTVTVTTAAQLIAAVTNVRPAVIRITEGSYDIGTNNLVWNDGVHVFGDGSQKTTITGYADCWGRESFALYQVSGGPQYSPGNNSYHGGFSIVCDTNKMLGAFNAVTNSGMWSGFGMSSKNPPANKAFTNVFARDIWVRRGSWDGFHFNSSNRFEIWLESCGVETEGLCYSIESGTASHTNDSVVVLNNCVGISRGRVHQPLRDSIAYADPQWIVADTRTFVFNSAFYLTTNGTAANLALPGMVRQTGNEIAGKVILQDCSLNNDAGDPQNTFTNLVGSFTYNGTRYIKPPNADGSYTNANFVLWGTNVDGTLTNINGGGVSVGAGLEFIQVPTEGAVAFYLMDTGRVAGVEMRQWNVTNRNTSVGSEALESNAGGYDNSAFGDDALQSVTTGFRNTAVGSGAGQTLTTAQDNTVLGVDALQTATDGSYNVAIGVYALKQLTSGNNNIAIGVHNSQENLTGADNVAVGMQALQTGWLGSRNVALGKSALNANTNATGRNTAVGYRASGSSSNTTGTVTLGYQAGYSLQRANTLVIHNDDVATPLLYGEFDTGALIIGGHTTNKGALMFLPDSTYPIGASASGRPSAITSAGNVTVGSSASFIVGSRGRLSAGADGVFRFLNNATTASGNLQVGSLIADATVTATNGFYFPQLSGIPSVDIRSSSGNTNWLVFNLGGDLYAIKTNAAAASSYITNKLTGLDLLSSKVVLGSAVSLTTDTAANVTSLSLGSGDWMVSGNVNFINGGGTTLSGSITSIGTTSATLATDGTESYRGPGVANWNYEGVTVTPVKITGPATVYLVTKVTFSISSCSAFGSINAEQVR